MLFGLLYLAHIILCADALVSQQITFSSHIGFAPNKAIDQQRNLRFFPSDVDRLPRIGATLKSRPTTIYRPRSLDALHNTRTRSLRYAESPTEPLEWDVKEVPGPDVEDRHTLAQLARMSGNAYAMPGRPNWYEIDQTWNQVCSLSVHPHIVS